MKGRTLLLVLAAGLMVAMAIPAAQASCNPPKIFTQWDFAGGCYAYVAMDAAMRQDFDPNPAAPTGGLIGREWQAGSRTLANEGPACPISTWLKNDGPYFHIDGGLGLDTGAPGGLCDSIGCNVGPTIILIEGTTTDGTGSGFAVATSNENVGCSGLWNWEYTTGGTWAWTPIPIPQVALVSNTSGALSLNVTSPNVAAANHSNADVATSPITSLRLMQAFGTQAAPPGRTAALWTFTGTSSTSPGTTPVNFNCTTAPPGQDVFFAYQVSFDNGAFLGDYVGAATQVRCNSTLANPKGKPIGKGHEKH